MKYFSGNSKQRYILLPLFWAFMCIIPSVATANFVSQQPDVFDIIISRVQEDHKKGVDVNEVDDRTVSYMEKLESNGAFSDMNYNHYQFEHLVRLKDMILSYTMEKSGLYANKDLYKCINNAFRFWLEADQSNRNWWYNWIAEPQAMGVLIILMRAGDPPLPANLEAELLTRMREKGGRPDAPNSPGRGANKIDIATHWVYRACLEKNADNLCFAADQVYYPLHFTTEEGLQSDYSYQQHDYQLYIAGYGNVLIGRISDIAKYLVDTPYQIPDDKLKIFSEFTRMTYLPVIRGKYFLYNVGGRSIVRKNVHDQSGFASIFETLAIMDSEYAAIYRDAAKRLRGEVDAGYHLKPFNRHYWRSDYSLHQRPGYTFDVRAVSVRTFRNEHGNGENLKGYYLSDGANAIVVDGSEYVNIFPVWDWERVPGTTTPIQGKVPFTPRQWGDPGVSTFVGGVSDGVYGLSTYYLTDYAQQFGVNAEAKKAWFMFDDEVVCLGAGIKSENDSEINTTLNQCLLKGDVTVVSEQGMEILAEGEHHKEGVSWVMQDKVAYFFPTPGSVNITNRTETGNYIEITNRNEEASEKVFKIWLNHGKKPSSGTYSYMIVPNVSTVSDIQSYDEDNIEILKNSESVQAVRNKRLNITSVVFYEPATFWYDKELSIRATEGCAIMIKDIEKDKMKVYVADPSRKLQSVSLILSDSKKNERVLKCDLPTDPAYAGSTQEFVIDMNTLE